MPPTKPGPAPAPASVLAAMVLLLLACGLGWAWHSAGRAAAQAAEALRTQQVLTTLAELQTAVATIDSAPGAARTAIDAAQARLRELLSGNAEQYTRLIALGPLLAGRLDAAAAAGASTRQPQAAAGHTDGRRLQQRSAAALTDLRQPALAEFASAQQAAIATARVAQAAAVVPGLLALLLLAAAAWRVLQDRTRLQSAQVAAADAQQAQAHAQGALQHLLDAVPDAVCMLDIEGRVVRANAACATLWGSPADGLIGRAWIDHVSTDDQRRSALAIKAALAAEAPQGWHNRCVRQDGSTVPVAWRAVGSAQQELLVCVGHDLAEIEVLRAQAAQLQHALQAKHDELAAARGRAEAAAGLNEGFIRLLGERMVQPPRAICSAVDILLQELAGPLTREQQRSLAGIREQARLQQALADAGLDLVSLEAGGLRLSVQAFDVWETANQVAAVARAAAQDKGLKFELKLADDLGYARGDAARVAQVLRELLHNAVRFTEHGSVGLHADVPTPGQVRFQVVDTGAGIAAEDQAGLFEPFQRIDSPAARLQAGSGLGLAVARRLARLMGGDLVLDSSQPLQGSRFSLKLQADDPGRG